MRAGVRCKKNLSNMTQDTLYRRMNRKVLCAAMLTYVFLTLLVPAGFGGITRVDLEIQSIQIQPARPTSETPMTAVAMIRNNGSEEASNFDVALSVRRGGKEIKAIESVPVLSHLPRLGTGLSVPVPVGKLLSGETEIVMIVDPQNRIQEADEGNNQKSVTFHVWPAALAETNR